MPPFLIPIVLVLGAGGLVAYNVYKKKTAGGAAAEIASQVATRGPRGENVFRPELAESLVRMLSGMVYTMPEANNRRFVEVSPSPNGAPVQREMSAYGWAESLNKTQSILAMMNLATANREKKFLRAVDPGNEAQYAGAGGLYAVLLYAGTLERRLAPPGAPPGGAALPPVPMDDQSRVRAEIGNPQLAESVIDLLKNGQNPDEMDRVANELERDGATFTVSLLRKRANQIRASVQPSYEPPRPPGVVTPPYVPPPPPGPLPVPPPPPPLPPSGVEITYVVATQTDPLTLRDAPSGNAIGALPRGSTFRVTKTSGGWAFGTSDAIGKQGWASLQFLKEASGGGAAPAPSPASSAAPYTVATQTDPLTLRASPGGAAIGSLPRGSTFMVDRTESTWAHGTGSSGQTGWASLTLLRAA
jgi:hypothetical protein